MQRFINQASFLLILITLPVICRAECVVIGPTKSSQHILVRTLLDGKPQKGVQIKIFKSKPGLGEESAPLAVLTSTQDGRVSPPTLSPGHYHLRATSDARLIADLYLDVSTQAEASAFSMELAPNPFPTREDRIATAEQSSARERVKEFRGVVYDPSGAVIPGVSIEIVRRGTEGRDRAAQVKSGGAGAFVASLSEGSYVALFFSPGFQIRVVAFDVSRQGSFDLKVTLQLGAAC